MSTERVDDEIPNDPVVGRGPANLAGKLQEFVFGPSTSKVRLDAEIAAFEREIIHVRDHPFRDRHPKSKWWKVCEELLKEAKRALEHGQIEKGWECFRAAQRVEFFGLAELDLRGSNEKDEKDERIEIGKGEKMPLALRIKAQAIQREAAHDLKTWQSEIIEDLLGKHGELNDDVSIAELYSASVIFHRFQNEQNMKVEGLRQQSWRLAFIALVATIAFLSLDAVTGPILAGSVDTRTFTVAVVLFGVIGASISGMSKTGDVLTTTSADQLVNWWITIARTMMGGAAALALFAFLQSGVLETGGLQFETVSPGMALVVAFVAGFSERFLVRAVETIGG